MMGDESRGIFVDQNQTSELIGLARLATPVQLRVRLENAEQLVFIGDRFSFQHTAASRAANLPCTLDKELNFRDLSDRHDVEIVVALQCFARFGGTPEYRFGAPQKLAILVRKSLFVFGSLASADASNVTRDSLDLLEQVFVLSPSDDVVDVGKLDAKLDGLAHSIDDQ